MQNRIISGAMISPRTGIHAILEVDSATLKDDLLEAFVWSHGTDRTWDLVVFHNSLFTVYTFMPKDRSIKAIPDNDIEYHVFEELGFPHCPLYEAFWVCGTGISDGTLASFTQTEYKFIISAYNSWYSKPYTGSSIPPPSWS